MEEPEMPAMSMPASSTVQARPPRTQPITEFAKSTMASVMPVRSMTWPASMKKGMAMSEKLSTAVYIFWPMTRLGMLPSCSSQITGGRPRQSSMGAPRMSSAANIPMHIQRIIRYASFSLLPRLSSLSRETIWSSWTINISTQQAHCAP